MEGRELKMALGRRLHPTPDGAYARTLSSRWLGLRVVSVVVLPPASDIWSALVSPGRRSIERR